MPPEPVIADTTPLITLAGVGLLELLPRLYGEIWIPAIVQYEYDQGLQSGDPRPRIPDLPWLVIQPNPPLPSPPLLGLDAGEVAAIALGLAAHARLLLLDDKAGRRVAQARNLPVTGTLGVLLAARQAGLIPLVAPVVNAMVAPGRYISTTLHVQVLQAAGEEIG